MSYDLFVSYSRKDNAQGRVSELLERIREDYRAFAGEELVCFFDLDDIHGMEDWRHRILEGLRHSSLLLLVLSPTYVKSQYCEWESVEYLKYEHARAALGQGVAPVYFVELPGAGSPDFPAQEAAWLAQVRRRTRFDLRPWHDEGAAALKQLDVRTRLEDLEKSLHERLSKLRRLADAPGNLPAHNPRFVGREPEMQRLHQSAGVGVFGVLTALQGMGGLGKTALAIQYACAYADFYPGGRWLLGCAGRHGLAGVIRELDVHLGLQLSEDERRDDRRAAIRVLAELERRAREGAAARAGERAPPEPRALLLLDNVDDPALLQPPESDLLTGKRWLHVLATTRLAPEDFGHDPARQTLLEVDALPEEDALRLIESLQPQERFASEAERAAAREIVRRLGGFTLAVEVVGVYLGECAGRVTCSALARRLASEGLDGIEGVARQSKRTINHVEKLLAPTLGPTLDLLAPAESLVLAYAALLPPDSIALPWLRTLVAEDYPELARDPGPGYPDPWADLVNRLLGLRLLQLVDTEPDTQAPRLVRMHRLVGELVRGRTGERRAALRERLTDRIRARSNDLERTWHEHQWEIPPLIGYNQSLLESADPQAPRTLRALCQWLPNYDGGRYSEPLLRACLAQQDADPKAVPTDLAVTLSNLGWALQDLGRYREAEPYLRRALAIDEQAEPLDEHALAVRCNQLEHCLRSLGRLAEAEPYTRRALELADRALGPAHPDTLASLNNLALLLEAKGDLAGAEPLYRRALQGYELALGPAHPDTLRSFNNLASLLHDKGDLAEAEPIYRRALQGYELALGPAHPDTLRSFNNLASLLHDKGDLAEAEPIYRRALQGYELALGPAHPDTLISLNNLALLLQDSGRAAEAEPLLRRSMTGRRQAYGPIHPATANGVASYALVLMRLGRDGETQTYAQEALDIWRQTAVPEDSRSGKAHWTLGIVAERAGDKEGAVTHLREALRLLLKGNAEDHPWVKEIQVNLERLVRRN